MGARPRMEERVFVDRSNDAATHTDTHLRLRTVAWFPRVTALGQGRSSRTLLTHRKAAGMVSPRPVDSPAESRRKWGRGRLCCLYTLLRVHCQH